VSFGDCTGNCRFVADIGGQGKRAPTLGGDLAGHCLSRLGAQIYYRDGSPGARKQPAGGFTDPRASASHQGDSICECIHCVSLHIKWRRPAIARAGSGLG
jgi:hypothetical protein